MGYGIYVNAAHSAADIKTRSFIRLNLAGKKAIERACSFTYAEGETHKDVKLSKGQIRSVV